MRFAISSRAGQVIAKGQLVIHLDESGELRLDFHTDGGRVIQGGTIDPSGDLTHASQVLYRQFFEAWRMSDFTMTAETKA